MIRAEEMPQWIPPAVQKIAHIATFAEPLVRRLILGPQMRGVWIFLSRTDPWGAGLLEINDNVPFEAFGLSQNTMTVAEQACTAFFWRLIVTMQFDRSVITHREVSASAEPWRSAEKQCRLILGTLANSGNYVLWNSMKIAAEYFDWRAQLEEDQSASAYALERRSADAEADLIRGRVRDFALATHNIYGSFFYGLLATTATTALGTKVTLKDVRNWCSGLPGKIPSGPSLSALIDDADDSL